MSEKHITLRYVAGSSSKEYQLAIVPDGALWRVTFAYGRIGETLKPGTKTQNPVTLPEAEKIFAKLLQEKTSKGYTPTEDGTPYVGGTEESRVTGIAVQLLNPIDEETAAELLADSAYACQEKFDGRRLVIQAIPGNETIGINRKGLTCGLPEPVADVFCGLATRTGLELIIDGEIVGDTFYAFDLLQEQQDCRHMQYHQRYSRLSSLLPTGVHAMGRPVILAPLNSTQWAKAEMFAQLKAENKEGIVFKRLAAPYTPGRPASGGDQFKHKFVESVDCVVLRINNKRSIGLGLLDNGRL